MNLTAWVDVAIGLCIVYLGASFFVTVINEYLAQLRNWRGRNLCNSLQELISDPTIRDLLAKSPALKPFFDSKEGEAPSYVDPNILASLLVGGLAARSNKTKLEEQVSEAVGKLPDSDLKSQLMALVQTAETSKDGLVKAVSDWTNRSLTVLGEGYKRHLQKISFAIGFIVAVSLNIDTVALTTHLYKDKDAREAAVLLAGQITDKTGKENFEKCMALSPQERKKDLSCVQIYGLVDVVQGRNQSMGKLPVGWPLPEPLEPNDISVLQGLWIWLSRIVGWLFTALALSLGAPFWFDLLNKLINVRYGMRKPQAEGEKKEK